MSAAAAQLRFAADFAVFLVSGAGLTLLVVRPALLVAGDRTRVAVAGGFGLLALAALLSGAFADPDRALGLAALPLVAAALLAVAAIRWPGAALGRLGFVTGVLAVIAAEVAFALDVDVAADWLRLLGAAGLGLGIFLAARRSIPARIATSASAILLAVVLAVSVGLSAVLATNVEDEAIRRLEATGGTEAVLAEAAATTAAQNASIVATGLSGSTLVGPLVRLLDAPDAPAPADVNELRDELAGFLNDTLREIDPQVGPLLLLDSTGRRLLAISPEGVVVDEPVLAGIDGSEVVVEALSTDQDTQSVVSSGAAALGVAAAPLDIPRGDGSDATGLVVVSSLLDGRYLEARLALSPDEGGETQGVALAGRNGVVASAGPMAPSSAVIGIAGEVLGEVDSATRTAGDLLLAARPIVAPDGSRPLAVVMATPTSTIQAAREDLFGLLFLIAIGGTAFALVLTALVGERIGAGLRRLTSVADEVTSGNFIVTSDLRSDDELGVLSDAFNSMTGSLRQMTADLRTSAEDESRLRTRLEAVVGGMGEALVAVDDHGDVTDFNAAAELLTGVTARKAMGRPVDQIVRLTSADDARPAALDPLVEDAWTRQATVVHATGLEVPVVVSAGPLRGGQNQSVGAVFVLRDVRREREIERIKGEFLSNISHELRTPLSPIKGYSQILRARDIPPEDVRRFANEIEKASGRLERVVVQLVNFASMSGGRYEVRTEPVLVREVLDRVVGRWSDRLDPTLHPIVRRVGRSVGKVWIDRQAVEQALDELVDNAVKFSPKGGRVEVLATTEADADGTAMLRLTVTDRGVGVPEDRLEDVVEDFTQADGSATRSYGGLGLGLALVGRIARAHGGRLEVASVEGKGTRVSIVVLVGADEATS
ncbi:MAG: PAS domain S-box protein [Acidimicrobiia bacterium]|nr:PAS domain S-box protein [Acidimicrobiia bacterium]